MRKYLCILMLLFLVGCATPAPLPNTILNFKPVYPTLAIYRGGQPNITNLVYLKSIGVSNIIKMDLPSESKASKQEMDTAKLLGMKVTYVPFNTFEQLFKISNVKVNKAVSNITPGTYIHCLHGQDRTGLIVALYKMKCGVPKKVAEKEMLDNGFHKSLHGLWEYFEHSK